MITRFLNRRGFRAITLQCICNIIFLIPYNMQQEEIPETTPATEAAEQQEDTAMYQSRRQAQAQPESEDPNDTFLSQFKQSPSFFFL